MSQGIIVQCPYYNKISNFKSLWIAVICQRSGLVATIYLKLRLFLGKLTREVNVSNIYHNDILLFCNVQSIRNTCLIFKTVADIYNPSILAIVETWLSDDISRRYIYRDYQKFVVSRNSVASESPGGGALLLFHPHYSVSQKMVPVQPPCSCNTLAAMDSHDGHCWVLVYLPYKMSKDVEQLCRYLNCINIQLRYLHNWYMFC